jgi:hypothetical protein
LSQMNPHTLMYMCSLLASPRQHGSIVQIGGPLCPTSQRDPHRHEVAFEGLTNE